MCQILEGKQGAFASYITTFSCDALFPLDSCKDKFDFFIQTLSTAIDRYLPIKVFLCDKINDFFVGLTSPLSPLTSADVSRISVDVIPEDLFSTVREVQRALNSIKSQEISWPGRYSERSP